MEKSTSGIKVGTVTKFLWQKLVSENVIDVHMMNSLVANIM